MSQCWYMYDHTFARPSSTPSLQNSTVFLYMEPYMPQPQLHKSYIKPYFSSPHGCLHLPLQSFLKSKFCSNYAITSITVSTTWYPYSGASSHMTSATATVDHSAPYNGSGKLIVGNEVSISISHIRSINIPLH